MNKNSKCNILLGFCNLIKSSVSIILASVLVLNANATELEDLDEYKDIKYREEITVGVSNNAPGLAYCDPITNEYSGYEIDIAKLIAKQLGVSVEFVPVTPVNRMEFLNDKTVDLVISYCTITEERKKFVDFSDPYFTDRVSVLVEKKSGLKNLKDLVGGKIGVINKTTSALALVKEMIAQGIIDAPDFDENTFDAENWTNGISFVGFDSYAEINKALARNRISGYCNDRIELLMYRNIRRQLINAAFAPQEYGIVFKKGSELMPFINEWVKKWKNDGTFHNLREIHGIYFND